MAQTKEAKWTPGPWVVRWDTVRYAGQREPISRCVISTPPNERGAVRRVATIEGPFAGFREEAEANAALLAAAPKLYDAARLALDVAHAGHRPLEADCPDAVCRQLHAALAAARGEVQP